LPKIPCNKPLLKYGIPSISITLKKAGYIRGWLPLPATYQKNNTDINDISSDVEKRYSTSINIDLFGIKESLNKLKVEHRQVLNLIYYQGYTHVEVADELGIPVGTVKTRWTMGMSNLKRLLCA